jgi:hypothetical protein
MATVYKYTWPCGSWKRRMCVFLFAKRMRRLPAPLFPHILTNLYLDRSMQTPQAMPGSSPHFVNVLKFWRAIETFTLPRCARRKAGRWQRIFPAGTGRYAALERRNPGAVRGKTVETYPLLSLFSKSSHYPGVDQTGPRSLRRIPGTPVGHDLPGLPGR